MFCKIDHCIHIHWCINMGLVHSDLSVESHMWPQQMWGQRSSRGQWPLVQVFEEMVTVSTYFYVMIFMGLGHNDPWSYMWPQQTWVKGYLGVNDHWLKFFEKKGHCIHILWHIFIGLGYNDPWVESHMWPQQVGSKVILGSLTFFFLSSHCFHIHWCIMEVGHNDPWVESHMGHQHMWGQRSSNGHLGLLTFWLKFLKSGQTVNKSTGQMLVIHSPPPPPAIHLSSEKWHPRVPYEKLQKTDWEGFNNPESNPDLASLITLLEQN